MKMSKLASILRMRCPSCHEESLFENPNPYAFHEIGKMPDHCPNCGTSFKREPGFYFGAAYVSYGLTVALWIAVLVALITFDALGIIEYAFLENPLTFLITGVIALIALLPFIFRLSRSIWIHIFVKDKKVEMKEV